MDGETAQLHGSAADGTAAGTVDARRTPTEQHIPSTSKVQNKLGTIVKQERKHDGKLKSKIGAPFEPSLFSRDRVPGARLEAPIRFSIPRRRRATQPSPVMSNSPAVYSPSDPSGAGNRATPSPTTPATAQVNGNGVNTANYMAPLPIGHQQDINYLFTQLQELANVLKDNRERVNGLTLQAEQIARRATISIANGGHSKESDAVRIQELEQQLAKANHIISLYKYEQTENTRLIAEYEEAIGVATEQIRNYCCDQNERYLALRRHYNDLLQQEKDEHLQSRLDRDKWHAETMKASEMIRHAYKLRCEEEGEELKIIARLQAEVRIYRRCLGMEQEKQEEETGWPYLKDVPLHLEGNGDP